MKYLLVEQQLVFGQFYNIHNQKSQHGKREFAGRLTLPLDRGKAACIALHYWYKLLCQQSFLARHLYLIHL